MIKEPSAKYTAPAPSIPKAVVNRATETISKRRKSIIRIKPDSSKKEKTQEIHYGESVFDQEQLNTLWKKYVSDIKSKSGGFSGSVLANCQPTLKDDNKTIHLIFRTSTNETEFERMSDELLVFLKSNLQNNFVQFETEVNKEKAKKVLYSNRDKFDHFTEKYPKLKDWENKLGLELN